MLDLSAIQIVILALVAIVTALTGLLYAPAVALLKANLNARVYEFVRKLAFTYVSALEQDPTLKGLASYEKKQYAILWLTETAAKYKLPLTNEEASRGVEEAVLLVKKFAVKPAVDVLS